MSKKYSVSNEDIYEKNVFIDPKGTIKSCFSWSIGLTSEGKISPLFRIVNSLIWWNLGLFQCRNKSEGKLLLYSSEKEDVSKNLKYFLNDQPLPEIAVYNAKCDERVISHLCLTIYEANITVKYLKTPCDVERVDQCVTLVQDMSRMLSNAMFSDFVIETGDGIRIPVHRNVLSARSPVFSAMLDSDMAEKDRRCLKIDDFSTQTVKDMIKYLYTGRIPELCFETASELLKVADKYDLKSLKNICRENLRLNLTVENAIQILQIADMYREKSLKTNVLEFISKNRAAFTNRQVFDTHLKQNPSLLIDVIECLTHCEK